MISPIQWRFPSKEVFLSLRQGRVHLWRIVLEQSSDQLAFLKGFLSPTELSRSQQFRVPHPQEQFIATRSILRLLLSQYLGMHPLDIQFEKSPTGKPSLSPPQDSPVQFNVSHTKGMALVAITLTDPIGVDLEWEDRRIQEGEIAQRFFSARESAILTALSPEQRTREFFKYWTCKEAYLKMLGVGLTEQLSECEITLQDKSTEAHVSLAFRGDPDTPYSLTWLDIAPQYIGAVAVGGTPLHLEGLTWEYSFFSNMAH